MTDGVTLVDDKGLVAVGVVYDDVAPIACARSLLVALVGRAPVQAVPLLDRGGVSRPRFVALDGAARAPEYREKDEEVEDEYRHVAPWCGARRG